MIDYYGPYVETPAGEAIGAKTYLRMTDDEERVELAMFPADTLSQARAFFTNPAAVAGVATLPEQHGWEAGPNFHFGHMQRGYCWTTSERPLDEYLQLWTAEIHEAGNVPRDEWDEYWAWLEAERIATPADRPEFDRHFTHTQRQTASPRPGLWLARRWPLDEAETLDSRGALHAQVRDALNAALVAFGEPPLPT